MDESFVPRGAGELPAEAFRMIVDGTAHPFVVIDRDGVVRYAGGSVAEIYGWHPDELIGQNVTAFIHADHLGLAAEAMAELEHDNPTGAGLPVVFSLLRPDGSHTWVEVGAMPLLDLPGFQGIVLRHRSWESTHHFDAFLELLLAGEGLDTVLPALGRSIAVAAQSIGAVVHHGFDGQTFAAASGWGVPAELLAACSGPWCDAATKAELRVVDAAELAAPLDAVASNAGLQACWCVPIPPSEGLAPAVLSVWRNTPGRPFIGHRHQLARLSRFAQLALVRSAEQERLRHLAGHDSLTGVANRGQFRERLAHALAIGERDLAVAFCDLDGFKQVNDRYGHRAGDAVLVEVASRLQGALRVGDELARVGGDEFTVLLRNIADSAGASHAAERLLAALREPFVVGESEVQLGLSIGIALASAELTSADEVLAHADAALYDVKRAGRDGVRIAD